MAGPYQTQDGQWQMAGRPISPEDLATWQAADAANKAANVAPTHPAALGQVPMGQPAPLSREELLMQQAAIQSQKQDAWKNPISAGISGLGNLTKWW